MKVQSIIIALLAILGCKEGDTFVTNITSPEDWQPPVIEWRTQPDPEVRGTVGIDFEISDSSEVVAVRAYLNGAVTDSSFTTPYRLELITDSLLDGVHIIEIRATDAFGNLGVSPILRINVMNSVAQGPQLIWVPDFFARIQDAIKSSSDFDTIRVRDGVYYESLNLFGKGIWLESERGPIGCEVDVMNGNNALYAPASHEIATIRGLHFSNGFYTIYIVDGSQVRFVNNIVTSDSAETLLLSSYGGGEINNNLFSHSRSAIMQISYHWGTLYNNIVQFGGLFGLWNAALSHNPLEYGYNLLWQNASNYNDRFEPGIGDVYSDPMINLDGGFLEEGSAAIDAGHPQIIDVNSTRSDIGPFGGPYAYNTITEGQNFRKGANHGKLGNETNGQFIQPMDSNGQKLKIRSTSGAYSESVFRVEIEEAADNSRRALKVKGQLDVEQSSNAEALKVSGPVHIAPRTGQELPAIKVEGDTKVQIDCQARANPALNSFEVYGKSSMSQLAGEPVALVVNGQIILQDGAQQLGTIKNGVIGGNRLDINSGVNDSDIQIGASGATGNNLSLKSNEIFIGGVGSHVQLDGTESAVTIDGPNDRANLDVHGNLNVHERLLTAKIETNAEDNVLEIGNANCDTLQLGKFASAIRLANNGTGAIVDIRGPVLINDGDADHQAGLEVQGDITSHANLGCTGELDVGGALDCEGAADFASNVTVHGDLSVGTAQQPANTTVHGNATIANGTLYVDQIKAADADLITVYNPLKAEADVTLSGETTAEGFATFEVLTAHLGGLNFSPVNTTAFTGIRVQNNRMEFFTSGVLRFYIDATGGHNA